MSKIARYQGNVRAFASNAQGMERTVFGGTNQADDLTSQITASFLRGWGIVGASEHPSLEDFNAAMYAMSQFIAYQHQMGVPEWHAEQEYHIGSICTHNGESYQSLQNANIGSQPPSAKWTPVLTSKNGLANLGLGTAAKRNVNAGSINGIPDMSSFRANAASNGYLQIPIIGAGGGGQTLIVQWGNTLTAPNSIASYNVNIAFPNTIIFAVGNRWANGSNASMNVKPFNTQQIQIQNFAASGADEICAWLAIGY
ncbi:carbohydrate-binding protein [Citrobacter sp. Cb025]|uniref:gp53-like domain-containing protein n=1 Tax=Citrobacter sp. Cb025 TaxID=2985021 RepID=UPI002574F598|nr:carbohydrate-binding protein [Citrobacter sp. Cb025]MDM3420032.1 carbohydrate-binding protein [Citrobacter sp. Cb025]